MDEAVPPLPRKGRGAISNADGRFERGTHVAIDDGWGSADAEAPPLETQFLRDTSRTVIARNNSPDIGFDRSINPYRGCEHGCIYCFARPTHAYLGLSPGLDFESRIFVKEDAPALLRAELSKPSYKPKPIALGVNTDAYQPIEKKLGLTRRILEVLYEFRHPVTLITKSTLIQRDIDILAAMARDHLCGAAVSVTTLDRNLARKMEPRAATPERRLETIAALAAAGIPTAVMAAPMIPALNDAELESIIEAAVARGAHSAGYVLLRLPLELAGLFEEWLNANFPGKAKHVMSLIKQSRDGQAYQSQFGTRMRGTGPYAELLRIRHESACHRLGLDKKRDTRRLDCSLFRVPARAKETAQLSLF
ncbi:MAG TPA: PA0069 family radical SAM protein [Stellaceae bacterium]|jgi:DNA repair photolyase|nr:PA0069 family radical SAM protein [Stellaceae bacterium]